MNKFLSVAGAAVLLIGVSLSATSPSRADPAADAVGAGLLGGFLGCAAGAAVAGSGAHYHTFGYDTDYAWRHHVKSCFRVYGDAYDPDYDTYTDDYGDDHRCRLR